MKNYIKLLGLIMIIGSMPVILGSCNEDDINKVIGDPPFAAFTSVIDDENTLMVTFTSTSIDADTYAWDFGDNVGTSDLANPTYTYTASGTYEVKLTVTNANGGDDVTAMVTVSGFGDELIQNGDMSSPEGWTSTPLWTGDDNDVDHDFVDGVFVYKNGLDDVGNPYQWSNHMLYQEVSVNAGSTYQLSADVSSVSGTLATWFEVYLVNAAPVDESTIGGDATQLAIKSFGEGENCTASTFDGDIIDIAKLCSGINPFDKDINENGQFTLSAEDLSATGTIFIVFKAGSGFAPEGETAGFKDGLFLDNVSVKEVL